MTDLVVISDTKLSFIGPKDRVIYTDVSTLKPLSLTIRFFWDTLDFVMLVFDFCEYLFPF